MKNSRITVLGIMGLIMLSGVHAIQGDYATCALCVSIATCFVGLRYRLVSDISAQNVKLDATHERVMKIKKSTVMGG